MLYLTRKLAVINQPDTIPTTFDKSEVGRMNRKNLLTFFWKTVNSLDQYATDEESEAHDNNVAYLVSLIGYDPICE
jgi:hypothetical protein